MLRRRFVGLLAAAGATVSAGCVDVAKVADLASLATGGDASLSEGTVAAGLREALQVGSQRASGTLARTGGFSDNPLVRIAVPPDLDKAAKLMRKIGLGRYVDELELAMNRSAERAVGEAVPVFWSAIRAMSIKDAYNILNGPRDAATQYFRSRTSTSLEARFQPIVRQGMQQVGLYQRYAEMKDRYNRIPFAKPAAPALEGYITDRAMDGLFVKLAEEEARIRENPVARTTDLLRKVFG
ncbi:MAG: DUF4197 family protein [Pseudomonadota bacterium]